MTDPVELTQSLIRCASVTPKDEGAQQLLINTLKPMGFEIHELPFEGNGSYKVKNFFARIGSEGPHLCYSGHTDVVPAGDEAAWTYPPFSAEIADGKMYGRGTSDMKGANAAFVAAVSEYLVKNGPPKKGSISMVITGDEESEAVNGTVRVVEWMKENGHIPDVCLVGESSNIDALGQEIKIGRRGCFTGYLTIKGKQGHVAYPDLADNPLPRLVSMLAALKEHIFDKGSAWFPPTNLEVTTIDVGNTADNVIPASGKATFNIRFSDRWTNETLEKEVRKILNKVSEDYELEVRRGAESFLTQPGEWTNLVAGTVEDMTEKKPELSTKGGTSDARFFAPHCPVVEFGLTNETIHQVDEHLVVDDLVKLTAIYKEILRRYLG